MSIIKNISDGTLSIRIKGVIHAIKPGDEIEADITQTGDPRLVIETKKKKKGD